MLNLFSYSSGFSAHALKGGAARTLDVDISPQVMPAARHTLAANRPQGSHSDLLIADVFPFVDELAERGPRYDIVVCDPPSLMRKRSQYKQAMGVYTKLNRNAFRLIADGGLPPRARREFPKRTSSKSSAAPPPVPGSAPASSPITCTQPTIQQTQPSPMDATSSASSPASIARLDRRVKGISSFNMST